MLLLCWLPAFVARIGEMVVFSGRVFDVLYLHWDSVGCVSIEALTASTGSSSVLVTSRFPICWCLLLLSRCTCRCRRVGWLRWSSKRCFVLELGIGGALVEAKAINTDNTTTKMF